MAGRMRRVYLFDLHRINALEQLLDCLHMEAGRGAENVRGPAPEELEVRCKNR